MNKVKTHNGWIYLLFFNSWIVLFALLLSSTLQSCDSENEQLNGISFTIGISDFSIVTKEFGELKSQKQDVFDGFVHKYPSGILKFTASDGTEYCFNTGSDPISEFGITLPVGSYSLSGSADTNGSMSEDRMSFSIPVQDITIEESTERIDITISPTSVLVLVADEHELVNSAYIEDDSNPFFVDGIYKYSYINKLTTNAAWIEKDDSTKLELLIGKHTSEHVYEIIVTDEGFSQLVIPDPDVVYNGTFTEYRGQLQNGSLIDARNAVWSFEDGWIATPKNTAKEVYWVGGEFFLTIDDHIYSPTDAWEEIWHHNGGWTLKYDNHNWTLDRVNVRHVGDAFNIAAGTNHFTIKNSYVSDIRDDAVQNDYMHSGLVTDNFFDGVYVGFSCRHATPRDGGDETYIIQNNLVWIKPMYSVFKGDSPGNGQIIKWQTDAPHLAPRLVFKNNIIRMGKLPFQSSTSSGTDFYFPPGGEFDNNILVWDGALPVPWSLRNWFNQSNNSRIGTMEDWDNAVEKWYQEHPYFEKN